jgi:Na+-transporting NADH:ubiquinone oxidoreductase subunit A
MVEHMAVHRIKKGLNLPITGEPRQEITPAAQPVRVALVAADYPGMRPTMFVQEGDAVKRGQLLFEDKKTPGVRYTAPGAGQIAGIHRGERRALQSVVIELNEHERSGALTDDDHVVFAAYQGKAPATLKREELVELLVESGLWTVLRTRPFGKVPAVDAVPHSIFVTAIDTNPLAPSVEKVLQGREQDFGTGLEVVTRLTEGVTYLCQRPGDTIPVPANAELQIEEFEGPHPAGLPGVHIHLLDPVHRGKTVWYIDYQSVVSIGRLFTTGKLDVERVIALAGPMAKNPRLLQTRVGAATDGLVANELREGEARVISGSVLSGRQAEGDIHGYLGLRHHQISVVEEGRHRPFLGWMMPGSDTFSMLNLFLSRLTPGKRFAFTTNTNGAERAMVPMGMYERVMPMDIHPTYLLRSLIVHDLEEAEKLGCLELDEEDLALCTFVCPSKYEYGPILRENLDMIEKEG